MQVAIGIGELFAYWLILYAIASGYGMGLAYRLQTWADKQIRKFEDQR